jgi:alpha-glucuronidase
VERGYAGRSLWDWDALPGRADPRLADYARANASLGINGSVLNNVNADARFLLPAMLEKIAAVARVFRPYGLRVYLSVRFSAPMEGRAGTLAPLATADPLDPGVRRWWREKAREIYGLIPDFGGFLVKADSEGMPGPQQYGRTHADGANALAAALAPHGGVVMWRAFVYDVSVDADRTKRSYKEFVPLDGRFLPNVLVQAKNGPLDFQPREPVQPLFGAMPRTPLMLELQVTQEYLGHSTHLVYLAPMWREALDFDLAAGGPGGTLARVVDGSLAGRDLTGIAGVANTGSDRNWTGHFFGQANWYAFGRLAWDPSLGPRDIAAEWVQASLTADRAAADTVVAMMMGSWEACVDYMTPLGLHHIMQYHVHYGPGPGVDRAPRPDWTSVYYHRADTAGIGFDRSSSGSGATAQYAPPLRDLFDSPETCPDKYLLWFHHVPWGRPAAGEPTLWDALCGRYRRGTDYVGRMARAWDGLEGRIDPEIFAHVRARLSDQKRDAAEWRDTCLGYFGAFSRRPCGGN